MPEFHVQWEIDIIADTHREAAELARKIHQDRDSWATVFDVQEFETDEAKRIDLSLPEGDEDVPQHG